jgi:hypothetical protein
MIFERVADPRQEVYRQRSWTVVSFDEPLPGIAMEAGDVLATPDEILESLCAENALIRRLRDERGDYDSTRDRIFEHLKNGIVYVDIGAVEITFGTGWLFQDELTRHKRGEQFHGEPGFAIVVAGTWSHKPSEPIPPNKPGEGLILMSFRRKWWRWRCGVFGAAANKELERLLRERMDPDLNLPRWGDRPDYYMQLFRIAARPRRAQRRQRDFLLTRNGSANIYKCGVQKQPEFLCPTTLSSRS